MRRTKSAPAALGIPQKRLTINQSMRLWRKQNNLNKTHEARVILPFGHPNRPLANAAHQKAVNARANLMLHLSEKLNRTPFNVETMMWMNMSKHKAKSRVVNEIPRVWMKHGPLKEAHLLSWNPEIIFNVAARRPYAKSASPVRRRKAPSPRRASSAPPNRPKPKTPPPHRRTLSTRNIKRVLALPVNSGRAPSFIKRARTSAAHP
jgi:hypothetical protein